MIAPFKVQFSKEEIKEYLRSAEDILTRGGLIPGVYNSTLEEMFASFVGAKHAVTVITGTVALEIIYRSFNLQNKDILIPANTNYATAEAALRAGANVVLYDSDLYPDFESIQANITKNTAAIVVVHIGGYITPDIERLVEFCKKKNIYLIEDASHAHGSKYKNRFAGTFGIASAFSMFATKVVTTAEGGVIISNDDNIKKLSPIYRDQGKDKEGIRNIVFGSAWRMSELHAALGIVQMKNISAILKRNNEIAEFYFKNIKSTEISIPFDKDTYYSGYKFIVLLKNKAQKDSLSNYLLDHGIKPGKNVYDIPLQLQPALSKLNQHSYPKSEKFAQTHLCLPIWKGMTDVEVKKVVMSVNSWSEKYGSN